MKPPKIPAEELRAIMKLAKCVVCRKKVDSVRGRVNLTVGGMKRMKKDGETWDTVLSTEQAKDFVVLFSVGFDPGEKNTEQSTIRRHHVRTDVQLPYAHLGQGELNCCSLDCLRRWFNGLVDHVERKSKVGRSKRDSAYRLTKFPKPKDK